MELQPHESSSETPTPQSDIPIRSDFNLTRVRLKPGGGVEAGSFGYTSTSREFV